MSSVSPSASRTDKLLWLLVTVLAIVAALRLGYEFWRLVLDTGPRGAVDLGLRLDEVRMWFGGERLYETDKGAVYPPASHILLWPLVGWLSFPAARWLFALVSVGTLVWFIRLALQATAPQSRVERLCVALFLLANYATVISIGNGQLSLLTLPFLVAGVLMLANGEGTWREDLWAAALVVFACVKPSNAIPFLWLVLIVPRRLRPAVLVGAVYILLSVASVALQKGAEPAAAATPTAEAEAATETPTVTELGDDVQAAFSDWTNRAEGAARWSAHSGYANLHSWINRARRPKSWNRPASILLFVLLGAWIYRFRAADPWLLLGVTGLTARFWTYHRVYDDVLVLLALVALLRVVKSDALPRRTATVGSLLGLATSAMLLVPASLRLLPKPRKFYFTYGQSALWLLLMAFLLWAAWVSERTARRDGERTAVVPG